MKANSQIAIIDITEKNGYEKYLYKCLAPIPFKKYGRRQEYLENAIPKGFHKKLLIFNGKIVGQIEYAPVEAGFATIGLENHWSPWLIIWQMEKLGFTSLDSITVRHETKHKQQPFKIHLMWLPATENARPPTWNKKKLLKGVSFCLAHPLYHPQTWKVNILEAK